MPEEENKTVDIDTSGPDTEVEITSEDPSTESTTAEQTEETSIESVAADSSQEASHEEQEATEEASKETKKEELEEYSAGVQKRIAKLTKRMREAERQREELAKKYQTTNAESLETKAVSIKAGIEAAKAKLAQAREAGDLQAEIEAQQSVAQLAYAQAELDFQKRSMEQNVVEEPAQTQQIQQPVASTRADPKAEEWAEKNTWFGQDSAMTYTAFDLHRKLTEDEGYDPKSDEYYAEIDKRIRLEFPHKFAKKESTESTKPVQTVASAKRSTKPGRKTVRLTSSQVAIAKKLGVPLEEYAKQLKLTKEA